MYLPGRAGATALLLGALVVAVGRAAPAPAALMALHGDAPGVGTVELGWLYGQPVAIVLLDRSESESATPVGNALNSVMVQHGGRRVSVLSLTDVPAPARPVARRLVATYRAGVLAAVRDEYERLGRPAPVDLERTAWLVTDWSGAWKAALAPECPGLAVALLDGSLQRTEALCDPTASQAAARFQRLLEGGG